MGTGGSRWGAGRPATHVKAEQCRRIDVRHWQREGILRAGCSGSWQWTDRETGEVRSAVLYRSSGGSVTLSYSIGEKSCSQTVWLSRSECNYGGSRPWFICPIRGERVAVLYLRAGRFACRHCQRLVYASQSDDLIGRTWRREHKAEAKLGEGWQRPKGMHQTTRERLLGIIVECQEQRHGALADFLAVMTRRLAPARAFLASSANPKPAL